LDGTREFVKGKLENVTVLIGITIDGIASMGVINKPWLSR